MKKLFALLIALFMFLGTFGCGGKEEPSTETEDGKPTATKIVIYAGGSSEFAWIKGSEEDEVINYIENKYYNETGNLLDFEIAYLGEDMRTKMVSELSAGTQIDVAISHTRGGVGIDDTLKGENSHYNIYDALYDFAPNLLNAVKGSPLYSMTTVDNDVIGIPSVISPYKFGILVRKDLMEAAGYTDNPLKAETEFKQGETYKLVDDLKTFEEMCLDIKTAQNLSHVITGASWDLEKVITLGAYADAGYFSNGLFKENGREYVRIGGATEAYEKVIETEYRWAQKDIVSKDANSILLEAGEANFISGKTAVFVQDPTVQHLIKVAKMTKNNIPEAEFTVLGPLTSGETVNGTESEKKGFMRNTWATFGAVVPASSKNVKPLFTFLNWVYKNEANYNLCRYGIEGKHWLNNGDGTYSYPQGKETYEYAPPYSGILTLVENQRMSDLRYSGYTEEEVRWIEEIAGNEENYIENDLIDYLFTSTSLYNTRQAAATAKLYQQIVDFWVGKTDPMGVDATGETLYKRTINEYNELILDIQEFFTAQYKTMKSQRLANK